MPDLRLVAALGWAAEALHQSAQSHKRAADVHRRQARRDMRQLDLIRAECGRAGVDLQITQTTQKGVGHSD